MLQNTLHRTGSLALAGAAAVFLATSSAPAKAETGYPGIEVEAGALYLARKGIADGVIVNDGGVPTPVPLVTTSDLEPDNQAGAFISVTATPQSMGGFSFHVGGFIVDDKAAAGFAPFSNVFLRFAQDQLGVTAIERSRLTYKSSLKSVEANVRYNLLAPEDATGLWLTGGVRAVQLDENLTLHQSNAVNVFNLGITGTNNLVGAQIGVAMRRELAQGLTIKAFTNAGLLHNEMESVARGLQNGIPAVPTLRSSRSDTSALLEAGLDVSYEFYPGVALLLGAQVMHISDVALAPDQQSVQNNPLTIGTSSGIVATDDVLYYGVRGGLTIKLN